MSLGRKRGDDPCDHHEQPRLQLGKERKPKEKEPPSARRTQLISQSSWEQVVFKLRFAAK